MKTILCIVALPLGLLISLVLFAVIPRDEWRKLNDSLPPP